jgi:hypothetical protein
MCSVYFLNCFQIDGINSYQFVLATIQTLKSGACGGPFLKIHRMYFVEQPAVFLRAKKITLKRSVKKMTKITRNRGRVSKLVAQPFFSHGSAHI